MRVKTGIILVVAFLGGQRAAGALSIVEATQARAVIVVGESEGAAVDHAAAELAEFLRQIGGAQIPRRGIEQAAANAGSGPVSGRENGYPCRLLIGPQAARLADPDFSVEALAPEGLVIRTVGQDLILAGGPPRGTLYAVYTFLQDVLGCRWWDSQASTIPARPAIRLDDLDVRYIPPLEYRETFWYDAFDSDWSVRNRCNGQTHRLDAARGGRHVYQGFVHTFYSLIPPDRYFPEHPEWFSEIAGKRVREQAQLCLTNESMRRELIQNLKERLRANPGATIASVSQNDCHGNCQCAACRALDELEGGPSGSLLHFVNVVAEAIEPEFPRVAISTLAYQYTRRPPKVVRPRANVIVRLCSIECSFSTPLAAERNRDFAADLEGWSRICDRLYIWDYTTNFRHHLLPHPNLGVLGPNVRFFADHNVKGLFEQGAYTTNGAEMAELRAWVLAQMMWDPRRDGEKLIEEFLAGYYGPAAGDIRQYLDVIHEAVAASGDHLGCFSGHTAKFLSFEVLRRGWGHLLAAEQAVGRDEALRFRVQCAQLPVLYAFLMRWGEFRDEHRRRGGPWPVSDSIGQVYEQFRQVARKKNVTRLNEHEAGFAVLDQRVAHEAARKTAGPSPSCADRPAGDWTDLQDDGFPSVNPAWGALAPDEMASDGMALRMPATHHEWALQQPLDIDWIAASAGQPVRCALSVRCEISGVEGDAFSCGIWDRQNKRSVVARRLTAREMADGAYHTIDLGGHVLTDRMCVWVAPVINEANVKAVWVDRIWLWKEDVPGQ
ncbi:MAG: DUF4838 domain-containing protein [Sedimentisphaerales bacterium]|nr:DUF4838 domain-containing protein [Sedimentisphaerales bacterium]